MAELEAGSRPQEIKVAEAQVSAAEVEKKRLEIERNRARYLFSQKAISTEDHDRALAAYDVAVARYQQALEQCKLVKEGPRKEEIDQGRAKVKQAKASLDLAETRLSYAKIYSPLDGVVLSKNIEEGEYVAPGTPVVTVADMVNVWLRAYVDEMDLDRVKFGDTAEITTDSTSGKVYQGHVSFISEQSEFTPKTVQTEKERVKLVYRIKIDIRNPGMELKAGMPADAAIK